MVFKLVLSVLSFCGSVGVFGSLVGPITINENGKSVTRYVVSTDAEYAATSGSSLTMQHSANVQIAMNDSDSYSPYMFVRYNLDGATLSFTADYSKVSCSCNGALYFVTMPALDYNGNPTGGESGNYYCDANDVNGEWCWEMDVMEANMYVVQTTPHTCSQAPGTPCYYCDGGGCGTNSFYENGNGMCPDSSCIINTQNEFLFSITFNSDSYHVTMTQNGQSFDYDICGNADYISNMQQALDYGMTLIMSYWGDSYDTMSWLDSMTGCSGDCDTSGQVVYSNITISNSGNKKLVMDSKHDAANVANPSKLVSPIEQNSGMECGSENHQLITHQGKFQTKEMLCVPKQN